jgi:hypothetical protein
MEEQIETRIRPQMVWKAWERVHTQTPEKGKPKFKVFDIKNGESFSILWKSLFVRLIFTHKVEPTQKGSLITYQVAIKGLFAIPVRWLIGKKIQKNVAHVLKSMVKELEHQSVV